MCICGNLIALFMAIWNYKAIQNQLISRLFKMPDGSSPSGKAKSIAQKSLEQELDLIALVKQQRVMNEALKSLLTRE